jgi:glycosyltransferase involved in cell wall biosynthesis
MKLSVVIPCLNAAETIGGQLDALRGQNWSEPWEVIIADNGSTDATVNIIKANAHGLPGMLAPASPTANFWCSATPTMKSAPVGLRHSVQR